MLYFFTHLRTLRNHLTLPDCENSLSPHSLPIGTFHQETSLCLSNRNSILMMLIYVNIVNPLVMGFQLQICQIVCFSWSILIKFHIHLQTSSCKTQMLLLKKNNILHEFRLFCNRLIWVYI